MTYRNGGVTLCVAAFMCAFATNSAAVAVGAECRAFGIPTSTTQMGDSEQGTLGGSLARTDYLAGGSYKTTTCAENGEPIHEVLMFPERLPNGSIKTVPVEETRRSPNGSVETVSAELGDLRLYLGNWQTAVAAQSAKSLPPLDAAKVTVSQPPPYAKLSRATLARVRKIRHHGVRQNELFKPPSRKIVARASETYPGKCEDQTNSWSGYKWLEGIGYKTNFHRFGIYESAFVEQTINGFHTWQFQYNLCGFSNTPEVVGSADEGPTESWAVGSSEEHEMVDGVNTIDGGTLEHACPGALACTWKKTTGTSGSGSIVEIDMRISTLYRWTIGAQSEYYDIWSVVAHEAGHAWGFEHTPWNKYEIMYPYTEPDDTNHRYLGKGDYLILHYVY